MYELLVRDTFAAAHRLQYYDGKCENLHGHNYRIEAIVQTDRLNDLGLGIDFYRLKQELAKVLDHFDHKLLNSTPYFSDQNPSAENIARTICELLQQGLSAYPGCRVSRVNVWESDTSMAAYLAE